MAFAVRHKDSPTTLLSAQSGVDVQRVSDPAAMAGIQGKPMVDMVRRFESGHRAYIARRGEETVAWGWVATRVAEIGELGATFAIPERERYLWNFVTLAAYRGQGVYPQLLRAIVNAESSDADRFWIAYAPENHASAAGIRRAGFQEVAEFSFDQSGRAALHTSSNDGQSAATSLVSRMLGLPVVEKELTPCWRCVRAGRGAMACAAGQCRCDYQRPEKDCAV